MVFAEMTKLWYSSEIVMTQSDCSCTKMSQLAKLEGGVHRELISNKLEGVINIFIFQY